MDPGAILARILRLPPIAAGVVVMDVYGMAAGGLLANGLAYSALFATVPITLVTAGLAGRLADDAAVQQGIADALAAVFPPLRDVIEQTVSAMVEGATLTSILGLVGTIWTVSRFYVALDMAFARIFGDDPRRTVWRQNLRAFAWVAILLGSVVGYIVAVSALSALGSMVPDRIPGAAALGRILGSSVTAVVIAVVAVLLAYRTLPPRTPSWSAATLPAVTAGIAIVGLSQLFAFIAPRLVGVAAFVGPLAVVFIALAWLSAIFQAMLIGAAWVSVRMGVRSTDLRTTTPATEPGGRGE